MSATLTTVTQSEAGKRAISFFQRLGAAFEAVVRHFVCRSAIANLHELDDRALRDIGLERSQIEAAVYGHVSLFDRGRLL